MIKAIAKAFLFNFASLLNQFYIKWYEGKPFKNIYLVLMQFTNGSNIKLARINLYKLI